MTGESGSPLTTLLTPLPAVAPAIIGRERELAALGDLVDQHCIVTMVGPGGIGKTRLAVELAYRLGESGWRIGYVELADVGHHDDVVDAIADQLGVAVVSGQLPRDGLAHWLAAAPSVLVLDNFEHVIGAAPAVVALAEVGTSQRIVVTSRRALDVAGECTFTVPPLAGGPASVAERGPGVQLLLEWAGVERPTARDIEAAQAIVQRLGGVPLAIELAGFRARTLGIATVLDLLVADLDLDALEGPATDERHRSLRSCIDWSVRDLDDNARAVLRATGAFAGTFDLAALRAVAGDERATPVGLAALVEHHLVDRVGNEEAARYASNPTIREYARDMLAAAPDRDQTYDAHGRWYASIAAGIFDASERTSVDTAIAQYRREEPNINLAILTRARRGDLAGAAEIACDVAKIAVELGREARLNRWFQRIAREAEAAAVKIPREARIWARYADLVERQPGTGETALQKFDDEIAAAREEGDERAVLLGDARMVMSLTSHGDVRRVFAAAKEGSELSARLDLRRRQAEFKLWLGMLENVAGDFDNASAHGLDALRIGRALGDSRLIVRSGLLFAPMILSSLLPDHVDPDLLPTLEGCLKLAHEYRSVVDELYVMMQLAVRAAFAGEPDACDLVDTGLRLADRTRSHPAEVVFVLALAAAAFRRGDDRVGAQLHAALRAEWTTVASLIPRAGIDGYERIVASRRSEEPDRVEEGLRAGAASVWSDTLILARQYAAAHATAARVSLTPRERDVLREMAAGRTNKEIALVLGLRPKTVMHHCAAIFRKLGVATRAEAIAVAFRTGLVALDP